jgi:hyaluronan synthase
MLRDDGMWIYAFVGTFFYVAFSPQLLWAVARIRDGKWGTRDASPPPSAPRPIHVYSAAASDG